MFSAGEEIQKPPSRGRQGLSNTQKLQSTTAG